MADNAEQKRTRIEPRQCEQHGEYNSTVTSYPGFDRPVEHASQCPSCAASVVEKRKRQEDAERCRKVERLKIESGVPARFARADFAGYHVTTERMRAIRELVANFAERWDAQAASGQSLLLIGGPGTGKTHLACAVINTIAESFTEAAFGTAAELVGGIKRNYGQRGGKDNVAAAIEGMQSVPLLVIDEIDVGLSDHDLTLLFRVIDGRYSDLMPMILISNRPVDQLEQVLGQRVMDRLRECAVAVAFDWPSHRGTARARGVDDAV